MRLFSIAAVTLLATAGITALLGQTVEGLDIEAVKRGAADVGADAQALIGQVKGRGASFGQEAQATHDGGIDNMRRIAGTELPKGPAGPVNFEEIVAGAVANANVPAGQAPQFIVFASLSMPPSSLRQLIGDTARASGVVVFRGFPNNSAKQFVGQLAKVVGKEDLPNIGIDPRLFRAFEVEAVPTYVAVSSGFDLCDGFHCQTDAPPHDRLSGNVTVDYALGTFAAGNGPGAKIASVALANLERSRRQ